MSDAGKYAFYEVWGGGREEGGGGGQTRVGALSIYIVSCPVVTHIVTIARNICLVLVFNPCMLFNERRGFRWVGVWVCVWTEEVVQ